jgi:hypothetical protein
MLSDPAAYFPPHSRHDPTGLLFLQQNPKVRFVGDIDRRRAGRFVSMIKRDRSQKTVNRIVSSCQPAGSG